MLPILALLRLVHDLNTTQNGLQQELTVVFINTTKLNVISIQPKMISSTVKTCFAATQHKAPQIHPNSMRC